MATIKSYSDLQQSKVLSEILPLESADMTYYACVKDWKGNPVEPKWRKPATLTKEELALPCSNFQEYEYLSCWSLAALLDALPEIDDTSLILEKVKAEDGYEGYYYHIEYKDKILIPYSKNPVDACVAMIEKLHELKML